jgi:hypothetical protein
VEWAHTAAHGEGYTQRENRRGWGSTRSDTGAHDARGDEEKSAKTGYRGEPGLPFSGRIVGGINYGPKVRRGATVTCGIERRAIPTPSPYRDPERRCLAIAEYRPEPPREAVF